MKKYMIVFMVLLVMLSLVGCSGDRVEIGVEDEKAYFHDWGKTPEMILYGENEIVIRDDALFYKLMALINGKPAIDDVCNCEAIYNLRIDKYSLGLHTHGIVITSPMGHNKKGVIIFSVACSEQEMNELFDVLESAK